MYSKDNEEAIVASSLTIANGSIGRTPAAKVVREQCLGLVGMSGQVGSLSKRGESQLPILQRGTHYAEEGCR